MPLSDYSVCEGIIFWCLFISCKCLIDILAINYLFASSYEQLIASIKNSGSFHLSNRSCDKLLAHNQIKLNSQNQFSDSSIHKYDFKICFPWILKLDIHCFCRQSSQLTYSLEYLWKAYKKRVWTASKWIHLNTKMNICSLTSFHFIVFYEVFAQLWLQSCLYRLLKTKMYCQRMIVTQDWRVKRTMMESESKEGRQALILKSLQC